MKNRPSFLSPIVKKLGIEQKVSLPPKYPKKLSPIQYNINGLCLRLKSAIRPRVKRIPTHFTFNLFDVTRGYMPDSNINIDSFTWDYRKFPTPKVRIINARDLSKRIYGFLK